jgi:hypothetical protein
MNKKTIHEITITEKLQHLPLPGMEDAIWARVKAQLDLDLPTGDDGGSGPDAPSGSGWTWGAGVFLFVAAFVAVFFLRKDDQQPSFLPSSTPVQNTSPTASPVRQPTTQREQSSPGPGTASSPVPGTFVSPPFDSLLAAPLATQPAGDSLQRTTLLVPPPVLVDTTKQKPKTKGVSGLTDADYRIVPAKKDSL